MTKPPHEVMAEKIERACEDIGSEYLAVVLDVHADYIGELDEVAATELHTPFELGVSLFLSALDKVIAEHPLVSMKVIRHMSQMIVETAAKSRKSKQDFH